MISAFDFFCSDRIGKNLNVIKHKIICFLLSENIEKLSELEFSRKDHFIFMIKKCFAINELAVVSGRLYDEDINYLRRDLEDFFDSDLKIDAPKSFAVRRIITIALLSISVTGSIGLIYEYSAEALADLSGLYSFANEEWEKIYQDGHLKYREKCEEILSEYMNEMCRL